jgi:hypothetical protein
MLTSCVPEGAAEADDWLQAEARQRANCPQWPRAEVGAAGDWECLVGEAVASD